MAVIVVKGPSDFYRGFLKAVGVTVMGLIIAIIMGGIIGWVASLIMKVDSQMGIVGNIIVGIVGSALGSFLAGAIGLEAYGTVARLAVGVAGAVLLIVILRALGIM